MEADHPNTGSFLHAGSQSAGRKGLRRDHRDTPFHTLDRPPKADTMAWAFNIGGRTILSLAATGFNGGLNRWGGCRPLQTASRCAKVVLLKATKRRMLKIQTVTRVFNSQDGISTRLLLYRASFEGKIQLYHIFKVFKRKSNLMMVVKIGWRRKILLNDLKNFH